MIEWKALEGEIKRAIGFRSSYCIDFTSKSVKETKYIKTYVETEINDTQDLLAVIIFCIAVGISFVPMTFISANAPIYGFSLILFGFALFFAVYQPHNKKCRRIILEAEQRILSEDDVEPQQPQETTTTPPQAQERTEPIVKTKERKYPDIWELYIGVAVFFFAIYPAARDYVENPSTFNAVLSLAVIWLLIFAFGGVIVILLFRKCIVPKLKSYLS